MPVFAFSLPADQFQKIHITADATTYNFKNGTTQFQGNVIANQGTTQLTADKVITKTNAQHQIEEMIAYGSKTVRAHYSTLARQGDPRMHAYGDIIQYYPLTANVTLQKHVTVKQGENSFQGELILYNMSEQTITVPPTPSGRAVLVYNPDR
jgi:lipopolysaccharide export system protein LptA